MYQGIYENALYNIIKEKENSLNLKTDLSKLSSYESMIDYI